MAGALVGLDFGSRFADGGEEFALGVVFEEVNLNCGAVSATRLLNDLADAFEGDGERLESFGFANRTQGYRRYGVD